MTWTTFALAAALGMVTLALVFVWRSKMTMARELARRDRDMAGLLQLMRERDYQLASHAKLREVLSDHAGGIGKRISECREIAKAIERHSPEMYQREHGLIYWLAAMDQFLVALLGGYDPTEPDHPMHTRMAAVNTSDIYSRVQAKNLSL